jgi:glycosyltransferase involved in cell wall biosynthesis
MRVFFASASFARSYGGPAYSVLRLAQAVAAAGTEVAIWAPDGSAMLPEPTAGLQAFSGSVDVGLSTFRPDVFHDSGLWLPHNNALSARAFRSNTPMVISTRGMLEPWALAHKRFKKSVAWYLYQKRNLNWADVLHVTSASEEASVKRLGLFPRIRRIPNGIDLPEESVGGNATDPRRVVFLGRLHPVKGLPMLLDAWAMLKVKGWELVVAGPDEDNFKAALEAQVATLGLGATVRFPGLVSGAAKEELLRSASLFVLPSHSESFGMVVAEACSYGIPVVATTGVPWPELEQHRCGWRSSPDASSLADTLRKAMAVPPSQLCEMGKRGRQLVAIDFSWAAIARQFQDLYAELAASRIQSSSVS